MSLLLPNKSGNVIKERCSERRKLGEEVGRCRHTHLLFGSFSGVLDPLMLLLCCATGGRASCLRWLFKRERDLATKQVLDVRLSGIRLLSVGGSDSF